MVDIGAYIQYLSFDPTIILPIAPFYVSFEPHLDATRCHQKAVNGVLKLKFSWGANPPSTARRWRAARLRRVIDMGLRQIQI